MSWQATAWASEQKCGGSAGKLLLYAISNYASKDGVAYPSQETLAEDTELSIRSVRSWLSKLEYLGLITRFKDRAPNGKYKIDIYQLHLDGPPENTADGHLPPATDDTATGNSASHPPANERTTIKEQSEEQSNKRKSKKNEYSEDYEKFWKEYPDTKGMSKAKGYLEWNKLSDEERKKAFQSLGAYSDHLKENTWKSVKHVQGYLSGGFFDSFIQKPKQEGGNSEFLLKICTEYAKNPVRWGRDEMFGAAPDKEGTRIPSHIWEEAKRRANK